MVDDLRQVSRASHSKTRQSLKAARNQCPQCPEADTLDTSKNCNQLIRQAFDHGTNTASQKLGVTGSIGPVHAIIARLGRAARGSTMVRRFSCPGITQSSLCCWSPQPVARLSTPAISSRV